MGEPLRWVQGSIRSRPLIIQIERDPSKKNWGLLTEELFHQGDVGDASYAAIPQIVRIALTRFPLDMNALTLVTVIDIARWSEGNPPIPNWLTDEYESAIERLASEALNQFAQLNDVDAIRAAIGIIAAWKKQPRCARAAVLHSEEELKEILY
jgi:hypothetical protein